MRTEGAYKLYIKEIRIYRGMLASIVKIGIPAGIQSMLFSISNIFIQSCVNTFGTNTVAAWTAYAKADAFYWSIDTAFGVTITTFIGQNFGAGKFERIHKIVKTCLLTCIGYSVIIGLLMRKVGQYVILLFTDDQQVISIGANIV